MKKKFTIICALLSVVLAAGSSAGCSKKEEKTVLDLAYYAGNEYSEITGKPKYSKDLWRQNYEMPYMADPQVFNNVSVDGYFYAYGTNITNDGFEYWRSRDLETWEMCGQCLSFAENDMRGWGDVWAPEVIYDETEHRYFMFFSATPPNENVGNGGAMMYFPMVAVSDSAKGPYKIVDFKDEASCGKENVHSYDENVYPQNCAKYYLFDMEQYNAAVKAEGERTGLSDDIYVNTGMPLSEGQFIRNIDLHPYFDKENNKKYLLSSANPNCIVGLEMETWLKPKYNTYKVLTRANYYSIDDFTNEQVNGEDIEQVDYETVASTCNEGPQLYKHDGKYYLSYSIGNYTENSYRVGQAVGDSPLGPFRKLTEEENGPMLSSDGGENLSIGGPGHHSFVQANIGGEDKLFITYHAHNDPEDSTKGRHVQIDEIKWITVKDTSGNDLDVMYVNGPTVSVQPTLGVTKQYAGTSFDNALLESGKLQKDSSANALCDGLLAVNRDVAAVFNDKYVPETVVTETSTFYVSFNEAKDVRGLMFYNSKVYNQREKRGYFEKITNIELVCEENGNEITYFIPALELEQKQGLVYFVDEDRDLIIIQDVVRGSGIWVEFNELHLKGVRFTVEIPQAFSAVGISEVVAVTKIGG